MKYADAPKLTPSMMTACEDLSLHRLLVVYPGERSYRLAPKVEVMPMRAAVALLR